MKKLTLLLALIVLVTQTTGCGVFRRLRDHVCRGAYCGATSQPLLQRPGILVPQTPQTIVAPTPPVVIPQASVMPCDPCVTCSPVCDPCCDGLAYPIDSGYGGCTDCNGGVYDGGVIDGAVIDGGSGTRGGVTLPDGVFPSPAN